MPDQKPVDLTPIPAGTFGQPTPATSANSNTMKVILASQKRWRIGGIAAGLVSTSGFAVAGAFLSQPVVFSVGLGVGIVGGIASIVCGQFSGAELDEKALERVADRVSGLLDQRRKP